MHKEGGKDEVVQLSRVQRPGGDQVQDRQQAALFPRLDRVRDMQESRTREFIDTQEPGPDTTGGKFAALAWNGGDRQESKAWEK